MRELLDFVLADVEAATVYSDDHPAYRRSIRGLDARINHRITPGSEHRDRNNSLWEVNLLDLLIRHSSANHKRETIAWSKRRQASAERLSDPAGVAELHEGAAGEGPGESDAGDGAGNDGAAGADRGVVVEADLQDQV